MITELALENFKCFAVAQLRFTPLTILTGLNGGGKSTVLQSLLLVHQGILAKAREGWPLSGPVQSLGSLRDVVDKRTGGRRFRIGLSGDAYRITWTLEGRDDGDSLTVTEESNVVRLDGRPLPPPSLLHDELLRDVFAPISGLSYIPADRIGPREVYPLAEDVRHVLGPQAERAFGFFFDRRDQDVPAARWNPRESRPQLHHQVVSWLQELFPGASFDVQRVQSANLVSLGLRTGPDTDFHRPQNVGFGITHVLPVLISCLAAEPNQIVLVENPENHLHPAAQSRMGKFLTMIARSGVQVIVETHSDHIINGVRKAVKDGLPKELVTVYFFRPGSNGAEVVSPQLSQSGHFDAWPDGFFDQFDRDSMELAGF